MRDLRIEIDRFCALSAHEADNDLVPERRAVPAAPACRVRRFVPELPGPPSASSA